MYICVFRLYSEYSHRGSIAGYNDMRAQLAEILEPPCLWGFDPCFLLL